ncbi:UvrD-helicase domain-containing protein [Nocardioides yefusunii]|uniref:RecBCD enzyme subunit RecB n=1 Tax=Nocardioides yefusunii TaxID=2500546 RepID=A0ABW1R4D2_9ACTN|nr:UvrD-helicase domain-containing protein [Nocardioides yefusunii]
MDHFDISAPALPSGTTLLEASAGTGKTWTIASLVTRYVAQGEATLDQLLVVTFTRAASQELRQRVREQLVDAVGVLDASRAAQGGNALHTWLLGPADAPVGDDERRVRLERLTDAVTAFDAATIATIHQFCQLVLRSLGVAGDSDREAVLVEDLSDLTTEVVEDLFLRDFAQLELPPFDISTARTIGRSVISDPRARIEPQEADEVAPDSPAAVRYRFAMQVRDEVAERKRRLGLLSYDDLLSELADALGTGPTDPEGHAARSRMQQRWKIVLVDEFQDTDPVQWEVFRKAFVEPTPDGAPNPCTVVLIGDPKQAIYGFRGGDVTTYLQAARSATTRQTLATNFRSDAPLVESVHAMLGGAQLGDEEIVVHPVQAHHPTSRLHDAGPPVRMRLVRRVELGKGERSKPKMDEWREHVITDLARDIAVLLTGDARIVDAHSPDAGPDGTRPVRAGDVAVLARTRKVLAATQSALRDLGIASVVGAGGSVFHTAAATEWITLLEALEQPHRAERVRAAALTSFFGVDAAALDADLPQHAAGTGASAEGSDLTDQLASRLRVLVGLLATRGVAAVTEHCVLHGLTARVLATVGGERTLTDLRHIGELLHKVSVEQRLGVVGLLGWLREQVDDERTDVSGERTRRLDSDDAAVQLVTIHGSKGLEYPIVYLPMAWDRWVGKAGEVQLFHDADGVRCLDVSGADPWRTRAFERNRAEEAGESLRLLYVAMTRARSQVVAWYAPSYNSPASELHRMLMGRLPGGAKVPDEQALVDDSRLPAIFGGWRNAGAFTPEFGTWRDVDPIEPHPDTTPLSVRRFTRSVDTAWRRTSYSALSAAASDPHGHAAAPAVELTSEPEERPEEADAVNPLPDTVPAVADGDDASLAAVPSPMDGLPMGATFGSLVHAVLEHADPSAEDVHADLRALVEEHLVDWPVDVDPDTLAAALVQVVSSPMGPLTGQRTLLDVPTRDRLCELDFEVPLSGGDDADDSSDVRLGDLAPLLRRHLAPGDAVLSYADQLERDPGLAEQSLRGYLTGSIDVVLRVTDTDGATKYLTVDYKTNWLGPYDQPLTAHTYRPEALVEAMAHSDYPLQALLYTVVLHRYLRWRLPDYDPATHLGGVLYLYLRGMCGPETPLVDGHPCGVFSWQAPVPLVLELSDLLDGSVPSPGAAALASSPGGTR